MKVDCYVFPDAVKVKPNETIDFKVDLPTITIIHQFKTDNSVKVIENTINLTTLRNGSSALLVHNPFTKNTYVLYNLRELCAIYDLKPQKLLSTFHIKSFLQIDRQDDNYFVKFFLPKGIFSMFSLKEYPCIILSDIHKLDRGYSFNVSDLTHTISEDKITFTFNLNISEFYNNPIYISYAGQTQICKSNKNTVTFTYVANEIPYFGEPNLRIHGKPL